MDTQLLEFSTFAAFLAWKKREEHATDSWYIQKCEKQERNGNEYWYYYCNRAGTHTSKGAGERCMKSQGTSKAVLHCSAHIRAIRNVDTNQIKVYYTATHYNHKK